MKLKFKKYKLFLRINFVSLLFLVISFISVTLAWFAYSGLLNVATEINVKAWYIELEKDGQLVSNEIIVSLAEIYPGMETVKEVVNIKNLGDSDAQVRYSLISARILDDPEHNYVINDITTSEYVEDLLSHEYPFHINMNLTKRYVLSKGEESIFEISISWPLDSGDNELDSLWGTAAYVFYQNEENKKNQDPEYQIRPSIQIIISLVAEQYLETDIASDYRYNLGDTVLFDVVTNSICSEVSSTCLETYIIDVNNTLSDEIVTLLPNPNNVYLNGSYHDYDSLFNTITNDWTVNTRPLLVEDLLKIISTDIINSFLIREELSDAIIGNLNYDNRMSIELNKAISYNGYYRFINEKFPYLVATNCYWTNSEYDSLNSFAVKVNDENTSKLYNESKTSSCNVVPVILVNKLNLQ